MAYVARRGTPRTWLVGQNMSISKIICFRDFETGTRSTNRKFKKSTSERHCVVISTRSGVVTTWFLRKQAPERSPRITSCSCLSDFLMGVCYLLVVIKRCNALRACLPDLFTSMEQKFFKSSKFFTSY